MGFQWRHPIRRHQCHQSLVPELVQPSDWQVECFLMLSMKRIHMRHCQCHQRSTPLEGKIENRMEALAEWFFTGDIQWQVISGHHSMPSSTIFCNHLTDGILSAKEKCENILICWIKPSINKLAPSKWFVCCSVS